MALLKNVSLSFNIKLIRFPSLAIFVFRFKSCLFSFIYIEILGSYFKIEYLFIFIILTIKRRSSQIMIILIVSFKYMIKIYFGAYFEYFIYISIPEDPPLLQEEFSGHDTKLCLVVRLQF